MSKAIPATIVNHATIAIAAPPASVWEVILEKFVDEESLAKIGEVTPLDDLSAPLGGYLIRVDLGEGLSNDQIVRITERDNEALRLSIFVDFLSVPGGMKAYLTYHAQNDQDCACLAVDSHVRLEIDVADEANRSDVGSLVTEHTASAHGKLMPHLEEIRAQAEGRSV